MLRYVLLGGALSAIVTGAIISAPAAASPICVWVEVRRPVVTSPQPLCVDYPLETICAHPSVSAPPVFDGTVHVCVPNAQFMS